MADGKLVQMLIFTDVTRYLEFKVGYKPINILFIPVLGLWRQLCAPRE